MGVFCIKSKYTFLFKKNMLKFSKDIFHKKNRHRWRLSIKQRLAYFTKRLL
jgi:hypothetical protein